VDQFEQSTHNVLQSYDHNSISFINGVLNDQIIFNLLANSELKGPLLFNVKFEDTNSDIVDKDFMRGGMRGFRQKRVIRDLKVSKDFKISTWRDSNTNPLDYSKLLK
jgi:hypothetical protein